MTHCITTLCMEMKMLKLMKDLLKVLKEFNTKNDSEYDLDRLVNNKSLSGQMQKIGFARIMISKPDILLDESTSNLDKESKKLYSKN